MAEVDISIIFAGLSIAASIVYYASVLSNANKTQKQSQETRLAQLHMQIFNELNSEDRWRDFLDAMYSWEWNGYDDFQEKYGTNNPDVCARARNSLQSLVSTTFLSNIWH
jgi:hypothetical protein